MTTRLFASSMAIFALALAACSSLAFAQEEADGSANVNTYGTAGNVNTGGWNTTQGTGSYQATDPNAPGQASGSAAVAGTGVSNVHTTPTASFSRSTAELSATVSATAPQAKVTETGAASQSDWALTPSTVGTYGFSGNNTTGTFDGSLIGDGNTLTIDAIGDANANGKSGASAVTSPDGLTANARSFTKGTSDGTVAFTGSGTPTLTSGVQGAGTAGSGAIGNGPNGSFGQANGAGNASYQAANPNGSTRGSLQVHTANSGTVSPAGNAASASSATSSTAATKLQ